jgi:hypothetical protein
MAASTRTDHRRAAALDDIPDPIRIAVAGLLREGPSLSRFVTDVRRAVDPEYRWNPWLYHRRFDRLVRWLMDEVELHRRQGLHRYRNLTPEMLDSTDNTLTRNPGRLQLNHHTGDVNA